MKKVITIKFEFKCNIFEHYAKLFSEEVLASKNDLRGLSKFSILLKLSGGVGDCNWQHTQLFRQPKAATNYPFQINLTFQ